MRQTTLTQSTDNPDYMWKWCISHISFFIFAALFVGVIDCCHYWRSGGRSVSLPRVIRGTGCRDPLRCQRGVTATIPCFCHDLALDLRYTIWPRPVASYNWLTLAAALGEDSRRPNLSLAGMTVSSGNQLTMTGAMLKSTASYGGVQPVYVLWRFTMQLSTAKLIANGENF